LRIHKANHFSQGFNGGQAMIAGFGRIFPFRFEVVQKEKNDIRGKMIDRQRTDFDTVSGRKKGVKYIVKSGVPKGIRTPVAGVKG
jgi:hypothetical protein